jgi:toxin ParE1/3/4
MPKIAVYFAESAIRDLQETRAWYEGQRAPDVGERILGEVFQRVESLEKHPDMGRIVPEFGQPFLPELIHPPFRIVYRRDLDRIRIVRVWCSERLLKLPSNRE